MGTASAFIDVVEEVLTLFGIREAPFIIAEDGTALQMRVDIDFNVNKKEIYVFGLCGGSYTISSPGELRQLIATVGMATTLYVYTVVPIIHGAPHLPLFAFCHDSSANSFTWETVIRVWRFMYQVCPN